MLNASRTVAFLVSILLPAGIGWAQSTESVVGTVTDETGAVVPGVVVQIRNLGTNALRTATTNDSGNFVVTNLPIGQYEATVEHAGFKRYARGPFALMVDSVLRIDIRLQVGDMTERVTVEAGAPLIETDRSSMGQVVENTTIVQLPLNGRHFLSLGSLIPGTTTGAPLDDRSSRMQGVLLQANGQRAEYNNYKVDGIDNNGDMAGNAVLIPSVDAIQEFKVQTANYSAEFGRSAGAVVNVQIRSGTNQLHGSLYEYLRNDKLDAAGFFTNYFGQEQTQLRRNQFGFSLGGPLIRDRTFLFGNFEGFRERRGTTRLLIVPTAAEREGNFADGPAVYDPFALDSRNQRTPFAGNRIPASRMHPASSKALNIWPLPNNPGDPSANYVKNFSNPQNRNQVNVRADHRLTDRDQLMFRYSYQDDDKITNTIALGGQTTGFYNRGWAAAWTRTVAPAVINEFRLGFVRFNFQEVHEDANRDYASGLGLPSRTLGENTLGHPILSVRNLAAVGGSSTTPISRRHNNYELVEQLTAIRGNHSVKIGLNIRFHGTDNFQPRQLRGLYTFSGAFTGALGSQYRNGFGDFLLGLPVSQNILYPDYFQETQIRNQRWMSYIQDDLRVGSNLTLNLGFRWELDAGYGEANNRYMRFDFDKGAITYPGDLKIPFSLPYTHRFEDGLQLRAPQAKQLAPRVGFAYRVSGRDRTVVRSAYGIFWTMPGENTFISPALGPPFNLLETATSGTTTPALRFGVFPAIGAGSLVPRNPAFSAYDDSFTNGYAQQWNFGIEHQLLADVALKASYVGSKGTRLERRLQGNPALPPGPGPIDPRRTYPEFNDISLQQASSWSTYHSLQLSAEKRMRKGLLFLAGYTWAKSLDDQSSWNPIGDDNVNVQDPRRLDLEKGRSAFDLRHRFTYSFLWQLPFVLHNSLARSLLGGWEVSGLVSLQTGFPFTPSVGGDIPNARTLDTRPNLNGKGNLPPSERTIDRWFNTAAFTPPLPFTFGTAGRNILDGPARKDVDLSVMKLFAMPWREQHRVQFRAEFFNFPNHPNFGFPGSDVSNQATFGRIRSGGAGREIQFALRYMF